MPPTGAEVLFINKTARSGKLSQSKGSERLRIYSHVQRSSNGQNPNQTPRASEVLYQNYDAWTSEESRDGLNGPTKANQKQQSKPKSRKAKAQAQVQTDAATDALQALQLSSAPQQLAPLNFLSGGVGDPFESLRAPVSPYMEHLFKFYISDVVPRVFPIKDVATTARLYTLAQAFEDPLQRDTLLCTTSAAIYTDSGLNRHAVAAMTLKGKVLASLRDQLSQRTQSKTKSFSSMYSIALLLFVECLLGNEHDLAAHIAGLKRLVEKSDLHLLEAPLCIFAALFACTYLGAALLDVVPDLKPVGLGNSGQLSTEAQQALRDASEIPSPMALQSFEIYAELLGPKLLGLALKRRKVMQFRYICGSGVYTPTPADVQYIYCEDMSVEYQLMTLCGDTSLSGAQHAVRLALFVFPQPFILVAKPNAAFCRAMTKQMKKWLDRSDLAGLWATTSALLLWVLFVTAHMCIGQMEWPWAISHLSTVISFLGIRSVDEMEGLLHGLYYHALYFRATAEKIWAEHEILVAGKQLHFSSSSSSEMGGEVLRKQMGELATVLSVRTI